MIKVTYWNMGDTYNTDLPFEERSTQTRYVTKKFKSRLIANLYIFYCKLVHDYIEVEEINKI